MYEEAFTWQVFKEEFNKEYLTEIYRKQKKASFVNLMQGSMTVREYTNKFEDLYKYTKEVYPTEEMKSEKFRDGLHISLRGKLNLYASSYFRGWVKKAMEQERLDKELETTSHAKSQHHEGSSKQH